MEKTIILDLGSGTSVNNDPNIIKESIDQIYLLQHQTKKRILIKLQLFNNLPNLIPLNKDLYAFAYNYAKTLNMLVSASVFDKLSLHYILSIKETPFYKIACRDFLYKYIKYLPTDKEIFVSVDSCEKRDMLKKKYPKHNLIFLFCVAEYPAFPIEYEGRFQGLDDSGNLNYSISDHTVNLGMYKRFEPEYYERHFILDKNKCNDPYGDSFASTANELRGIL